MSALPLISTPYDGLSTDTSQSQLATEELIAKILREWGKAGPVVDALPLGDGEPAETEEDPENETETAQLTELKSSEDVVLNRMEHMHYLISEMKALPPGHVTLDAARPWLLFWYLNALDILNVSLDPRGRERAVETLLSFQNPEGGFGGGPGQLAHLAPTYAAVLALACVTTTEAEIAEGGPDLNAWEAVDREKMYDWMLALKQPDGSFVMHVGGEVDVRGCYCALVIATLLNIITPELVHNTSRFIASCQTYEGGLASASHPLSSPSSSFLASASLGNSAPSSRNGPNPQLGEAHGGYTHCAVLCHFLLQPFMNEEEAARLDVDACLRWAVQMQACPVEGGGFRGRTNKLVDGCYSWWCGGLFPVLEALKELSVLGAVTTGGEDVWMDDDSGPLFDRLALQEYTLLVAQCPEGGLRDKPDKPRDGYHTHYNLAGLSMAQHRLVFDREKKTQLASSWKSQKEGTGKEVDDLRREVYAWSLAWEEVESDRLVLGPKDNLVETVHPVFLLKPEKVRRLMDYFYGQS